MDEIIQSIVFWVFHGKSTTFKTIKVGVFLV
jgi:hypothetical protein